MGSGSGVNPGVERALLSTMALPRNQSEQGVLQMLQASDQEKPARAAISEGSNRAVMLPRSAGTASSSWSSAWQSLWSNWWRTWTICCASCQGGRTTLLCRQMSSDFDAQLASTCGDHQVANRLMKIQEVPSAIHDQH